MKIQESDPLLFVCTETRTTSEINDGELEIRGYKMIRSDSPTRHSGGVVVYYRSDVAVEFLEDVCFGYNNVIVCRVRKCVFNGIWMAIYHSPNASHREFVDKLKELCTKYMNANTNTYITGDFNIDFGLDAAVGTYRNEIIDFMRLHYLDQRIKRPTRVTQTTRTLIDPFFTDKRNKLKVLVSQNDSVADHNTIVIEKSVQFVRPVMKTIKDRTRYSRTAIQEKFNERFDHEQVTQLDVTERVKTLEAILRESVGELVSTKDVNVNHLKKWYGPALKKLKEDRNAAHLYAQISGSDAAWARYRQLRNKYTNNSRAARNNWLKDTIVRLRNDPKKLWTEVKRLMANNNNEVTEVVFDGEVKTDKTEIADCFNRFFVDSVRSINQSIPFVQYENQNTVQRHDLWSEFQPIELQELWSIICDIKTKSGIDDVNIDVIRDTFELCGSVILDVVNESLLSGRCPECCNETLVVPIRKVQGTVQAQEFRPINMIRMIDKILQNAVNRQLQRFLDEREILCSNQSGFRKKHSCETAVNLVIDEWRLSLERGKTIIVVFLDLKRAFETIDRGILIKKMRYYGVTGKVISWFESWLSDRIQLTRFGNVVSQPMNVSIGVPQGTPLSCPLFNLYVNDLPDVPDRCNVNMFADDTILWLAGVDRQSMSDHFKTDIDKLSQYFKMCKLMVNVSKTKCMIMTKETTPFDWRLDIDNQQIERVSEMKYLGVIIDEKLTFKPNTEFAKKKIAKKVYFLQRMKRRIDKDTKLTLYKTLIVPHIDYCSTMLLLANESEYREIQVICNRALRSILLEDRYASVTNMLELLDVLDVKQRVYYNTLIFVYKMKMSLLPQYLSRNLVYVQSVQPYVLRSNDQFRLPHARSAFAQNCLFYKGVQLFNDMRSSGYEVDCEMRDFKCNAKLYVKSRYASH